MFDRTKLGQALVEAVYAFAAAFAVTFGGFLRTKLGQALVEAVYAFAAAFAVTFGGFLSGLSKFPNYEEGRAALTAAVVAGLVALGKGVLWFFTGTRKPTA